VTIMGSKKMGFKSQPYAGKSSAKTFPKAPAVKGNTGKGSTVLPAKGK